MDSWIEGWLGQPRFAKYVLACNGDRRLALELYEWNIALGQGMMRDIAHFEVALRNAYDLAITERWNGKSHWILDAHSPAIVPIWRVRSQNGYKRGTDVNYLNRNSVDRAIKKCGGSNASPGKVVAELSFGFWKSLTSTSHEKTLWVPFLNRAYQRGARRSEIEKVISTVNTVRNRIAHHEPMFDRDPYPAQAPERVLEDLMKIFYQLAPEAAKHTSDTSTTLEILAEDPRRGALS